MSSRQMWVRQYAVGGQLIVDVAKNLGVLETSLRDWMKCSGDQRRQGHGGRADCGRARRTRRVATAGQAARVGA